MRWKSAGVGLVGLVCGVILALCFRGQPAQASKEAAAGPEWEYKYFAIQFPVAPSGQPDDMNKELAKITADGWEPAGWQHERSGRASQVPDCVYIAFKRPKK